MIFCFREEFSSHGLSDVVSVECRDVCREGFGLSGEADAGELVDEGAVIGRVVMYHRVSIGCSVDKLGIGRPVCLVERHNFISCHDDADLKATCIFMYTMSMVKYQLSTC